MFFLCLFSLLFKPLKKCWSRVCVWYQFTTSADEEKITEQRLDDDFFLSSLYPPDTKPFKCFFYLYYRVWSRWLNYIQFFFFIFIFFTVQGMKGTMLNLVSKFVVRPNIQLLKGFNYCNCIQIEVFFYLRFPPEQNMLTCIAWKLKI